MKRSTLLKAFLVLALLTIGLWYLSIRLEWRETPHQTGYSEAARRNPLHAGLLLLRQLGIEARFSEDATDLDAFSPQGTLLLSSGLEHFATPSARNALLAWIGQGGHLLLSITAKDRKTELLNALGIEILGQLPGNRRSLGSEHAHPQTLTIEDSPLIIETSNDLVFRIHPAEGRVAEWQASLRGQLEPNEETPIFTPLERPNNSPQARKRAVPREENSQSLAIFARYPYGKGTITVGSLASFANQAIARYDHAELFVRLATLPQGPRPVLILQAPPYPSLPAWLMKHAPEALLAAALLLIAGLWRVIPRFGPLLPEPPAARPSLAEHLAASGRFLLHEQNYEALIAPLRDELLRLLEALRHRHPEIDGKGGLACHLSGISPAEMALAFSPDPLTRQDFLRRVRTLATLREHCLRLRQSSSGALS